jgi:hypothetical protein
LGRGFALFASILQIGESIIRFDDENFSTLLFDFSDLLIVNLGMKLEAFGKFAFPHNRMASAPSNA